jgi:hypothetical protein
MDEEEKAPGFTWDIVEIIFVIFMGLLLVQALFTLPHKLRYDAPTTTVGKVGVFLGINRSIAVGSFMRTVAAAPLFFAPDAEQFALLREKTTGKVVEGPIDTSSGRWWHVHFDSGEDGWTREIFIESDLRQGLAQSLSSFVYRLRFFSAFISLLLLFGILYVTLRFHELNAEDKKAFAVRPGESKEVAPQHYANPKWLRVLEHVESESPNDWRLALLEADIMLEDMLDVMGYLGDTLGEKLRGAEKANFTTLPLAWEAHRIRNQIAHQGADFQITQREARRVVNLYRDVFKEFRYI